MTDRQRAALLARARAHLRKTTQGHVEYAKSGTGGHWKAAEKALDALAAELAPKAKVPALGPVVAGGQPILAQDLTHETGGLAGFPAFDDGFGHPGMGVIAPEPLTVTAIGSAVRRDGRPNGKSVHATGASGIRYWFGHLENVPAVGAKIAKGRKFAIISANHEMPHVHVGIDASPLLGHELAHHTNYTHGAPTVGAQLGET